MLVDSEGQALGSADIDHILIPPDPTDEEREILRKAIKAGYLTREACRYFSTAEQDVGVDEWRKRKALDDFLARRRLRVEHKRCLAGVAFADPRPAETALLGAPVKPTQRPRRRAIPAAAPALRQRHPSLAGFHGHTSMHTGKAPGAGAGVAPFSAARA